MVTGPFSTPTSGTTTKHREPQATQTSNATYIVACQRILKARDLRGLYP